jgi:histidinol-phosphate aminotransferase
MTATPSTPPAAAPAAGQAGIAALVARTIRDDVRAGSVYPVEPAAGLIKLDAMENPYRLPAELARRLGERLADVSINRYPPADPQAFKQRLAARIGLPGSMQLMLGNGSDELIHLLIQACARGGPEPATVLAPAPSFVMYQISARLDLCRYVGVPLGRDFALDAGAMIDAIRTHRPAVTFIAYPNNPTGTLYQRAAIDAVLDAALDTGAGLVVLDEAYLPFAQDTWLPQLATRPNLLVLRTLSKLGLAGLRLGYLCGDPAWIGELEKVRPPYNVNVLTLAAADFLLDHFDVLEQQAAQLRAARGAMDRALRALPRVAVFDSAANFILVRVADADATYAALKQRGILIKNVSRMHPQLANCLRITIGTPEENDAVLAALRASL